MTAAERTALGNEWWWSVPAGSRKWKAITEAYKVLEKELPTAPRLFSLLAFPSRHPELFDHFVAMVAERALFGENE